MKEQYVSFLRAVNVGSTGKIKMTDLKHLYEELGCSEVKTVLQTGNVIFTAGNVPKLADAIEVRFSYRPEIIVRKLRELIKLFKSKPFSKYKNLKPSWQVVMFLTAEPDEKLLRSIELENEEIWVKGKELYIAFFKGIGRSKLTSKKIENILGVSGSMRNWNTIEKIVGTS